MNILFTISFIELLIESLFIGVFIAESLTPQE